MRDNTLKFNDNVTISASTKSAIVDLGKTGAKGVWVEIVHVGVIGGTASQITAQIQYSDSATMAGEANEFGPDLVRKNSTTGFNRAVLCQTRRRYAQIVYTVTGTTPSFTGIYAHVGGPQRDDPAGVNTN